MSRIACIQHGDYFQARSRFAAGGEETYGSQRYSVEAQERLFAGADHLVISLDGVASDHRVGRGRYVCLPETHVRVIPGRIRAYLRARRITHLLKEFGPTQLLLRANDILGCEVLRWAAKRRIPTAVILASRFDPKHGAALRFCALANQAHVRFVGNHNLVATRSLLECGLDAKKAIAWDYPPRQNPDELPAKRAPNQPPWTVFFAGNLIPDKGAGDLVEAVSVVRARGFDVHLTICGDGPQRAALSVHRGVAEGWLSVLGVVPSDEIARHMLASWLVVVPTRPAFPEALPLVIIEALASRTPLLLSEHPIFSEYFQPEQAVEFFPPADVEALAERICRLAEQPERYAKRSSETAAVWHGLQIPGRFHVLLEKFAHETGAVQTPR